MNNNIFRHYATTPAPSNFTGEDVIGDTLYQPNQTQQTTSRIPQHIQSKAQQQYQYHQQEYEDPNLEEINIQQEIPVNQAIQNQSFQQSTTITKNVVINLVVNLKINAI